MCIDLYIQINQIEEWSLQIFSCYIASFRSVRKSEENNRNIK